MKANADSDAATLIRRDKPAAGSVCAIVPTFNRSGLLHECLTSLLRQTQVPDQIIVINDGSSDDTEAVARAFGGPVEVHTTENRGKAAALNLALSLCRCDLVWVCDDDDLAEPEACAALAAALAQAPQAAFAYGRFDRFRDSAAGRQVLPMSYWPDAGQTDLFLALAERFFVCQFSMMVRRSAYMKAGPFREDLIRSQDYEMTLRLARLGPAVLAPGILFHQRQHTGARGANQDRFDADAAGEKWLDYDKAFFAELLPALKEKDLVPPFARDAALTVRSRAAKLQSACIKAKHAMWDEAAADLGAACRLGGNDQPLPGELAVAGRMLADDLQSKRLLHGHASALSAIRACHRGGAYGRLIVEAMQGPARWKALYAVKSRDLGLLKHSLALALSSVGAAGTARVFLKKPDGPA